MFKDLQLVQLELQLVWQVELSNFLKQYVFKQKFQALDSLYNFHGRGEDGEKYTHCVWLYV